MRATYETTQARKEHWEFKAVRSFVLDGERMSRSESLTSSNMLSRDDDGAEPSFAVSLR
jgi:hypothetical protein